MKQNNQFLVSLDKYNVISMIGSGSFARVLLIEDKETKSKYAAKIFKMDSNDFFNVEKMIHFLSNFRHPTLLNILGYSPVDFDGNKFLTIITKYSPLSSLQEVIKKIQTNPLDNTILQIILVGISRGMLFLHKNKIIHRDLKPANVIIDENYHPHISGFTLCTEYVEGQELSEICGSGYYMAPEVFDGSYDFKADVYSFSILLFEVVTGQNAFLDARSLFQLQKLIKDGYRPEFKSPVKISIQTLIERSWSEDPDERPDFEEIYNKLAFDDEYLLDNVDKEKLNSYIDSIK